MRPLKTSLLAMSLASSVFVVACGGDDDAVGDDDSGTGDASGFDTRPNADSGKDTHVSDGGTDTNVATDDGVDTTVTDGGVDVATDGGTDTTDAGTDTHDAAATDTGDAGTDTHDAAATDAGADTRDAAASDASDAGADVTTDVGTDSVADATPTDSGPLDELWVVRVGDGSTPATSGSSAIVFLDKFMSDGTATGSPIALPIAASGAQQPLTLANNSTSEGFLTLSTDGHFVTLAGYGVAPGMASVTGATAAAPRVVGRISATGTVDTSTVLAATSFAGSNVRSAVTTDGNAIWVGGTATTTTNGGVHYTTFGATGDSGQLSGTPTNVRTVNVFGGQLYSTSASGAFFGPTKVGDGLPITTGQTSVILPGFPTTAGSPYQFVAFDRDATAGIDTIYLADDASTGGIQRWKLTAGTWTKETTFSDATLTAVRALTGKVVGSNVVLYGVSNNTKIVTLTDTGALTAALTTVATAATNNLYRGVAFAPR